MAKRKQSPISVVEQADRIRRISEEYSFLYGDTSKDDDEGGVMSPKSADSVSQGRKIAEQYNYDDLPEEFKVAHNILNSPYMKAMAAITPGKLT